VVPSVVLVGYLLRVRGAAARERPAPPTLDEVWPVAKEGISGTVALLPLFLVLQVAVGLSGLVSPLAALAAVAVVSYYTPAFLTVYSVERSAARLYGSGAPFRMAHSVPYLLGAVVSVFVYTPLVLGALVVAAAVEPPSLLPLGVVLVAAPLFTAGYWGYVYSETVGRRKHRRERERTESFFDDDRGLEDD
jgi:hypothetical protein